MTSPMRGQSQQALNSDSIRRPDPWPEERQLTYVCHTKKRGRLLRTGRNYDHCSPAVVHLLEGSTPSCFTPHSGRADLEMGG